MQVDAYDKAIGRVRMNPILQPEEQLRSLVEKLKALNPQYDGNVEHKIEGGRLPHICTDLCRRRLRRRNPAGKINGLRLDFPGEQEGTGPDFL